MFLQFRLKMCSKIKYKIKNKKSPANKFLKIKINSCLFKIMTKRPSERV